MRGKSVTKRITLALGFAALAAPAAFAGKDIVVPEIDGGFALAATAIVIGVGAVLFEKYRRT
jgi:hypothetical protein